MNDQMNALTSSGETSSDIVVNIIQGFMVCTDNKHIKYIELYIRLIVTKEISLLTNH
jgi:hypothetical protein